jgi:hypothetical protein
MKGVGTMMMNSTALTAPDKHGDGTWQKKAERAKQAREDAKTIRGGKPATFRSRSTLARKPEA